MNEEKICTKQEGNLQPPSDAK